MVKIELNLKQLMSISDDMTTEEFEKSLNQYDPKDIIGYLVEEHRENKVDEQDSDEGDINGDDETNFS